VSNISLPGPGHELWQRISTDIRARTGREFSIETVRPVSGGCINQSAAVSDASATYFVKINASASLPAFEAETQALQALAATNTLRVPMPVCSGKAGACAWLVLEYLGALGASTAANWSLLGSGLANMHRYEQECFGWHHDNTIGSTLQVNTLAYDWIDFFRDQRIGYQLDLAIGNGYARQLETRGNSLLDNLGHFFAGYKPRAGLLHGDLWAGNVGFSADGVPVVFDPASYYGDRETDIAMTELFGGFTTGFYRAYESVWPLDNGYAVRKHLYNLYHLLNHLNLFGAGYLTQCRSAIDRLLAELG
jgi:protein-ribulosamine 3-kinase